MGNIVFQAANLFGKTAAQPQANQAERQPENRKSHVSGCRFTWEYYLISILQTAQRQPENQETAFSGCPFIWKDCSTAIIQSSQKQPEKHITHPCAVLSQYCAGKNPPTPFSGCLSRPTRKGSLKNNNSAIMRGFLISTSLFAPNNRCQAAFIFVNKYKPMKKAK